MDELGIQKLNQNIDELISLCEKLKRENHTLRQSYAHKQQEFLRLQERSHQAQAKVESLLVKFKAEQE